MHKLRVFIRDFRSDLFTKVLNGSIYDFAGGIGQLQFAEIKVINQKKRYEQTNRVFSFFVMFVLVIVSYRSL